MPAKDPPTIKDVHQSNQVQHRHPFQALYLLPMPAHHIFLPQIGVVQSQNACGNRSPMAHCTRFAIPLLLLLPRRVAATILNQPQLLLPPNVMNLPNLVPSGMQLMGRESWDGAAQMVHDGKTFKKPRRPYEKERLDAELKLVGEYRLRCKRELWRVQCALSRIRNNARMLLTLDEKNPRRIFEGEALLCRMNRYGLLDESQNKLDFVLALTVENFLER